MKSITTITALVAALAVTSGGLGLSLTGVFDDNNVTTTSNTVNGLMMGHLVVEAHNEAGELVAYRQSDNEVVDDGEQCILKMLFATTGASEAGRGEYASTTACTGALTNAWDVIAIGTGSTTAADTQVILVNETGSGTNNADGMPGLERGTATTKTWTNGTSNTTTKIVLSKTFTSNAGSDPHLIGESGLFNSTTADANGMLARQTFTDVSLSNGDSITITWTFTVGN